ncbi:hypothetical protein M3Y94_01104000 [Aphelenchoides besseyi]|nr:hypothetical protein M3Y94_01104000 [Aphelenchoides besseyi]KAI6221584.1 hypothetical protein M3Y95_00977600 [Aphelenchoides besseyi]
MRVNLFVFVLLLSATVIIAAPIDWFPGNGAEPLVDDSNLEKQNGDEEPFDARQHASLIDSLTEDNEKKQKDDSFKETINKRPPAHWTYPEALNDLH